MKGQGIGMWVWGIVLVALFCLSPSVYAKPIVANLALRSIDIDHNFTGIDILLFGAREDVGRVVVVIRGPEKRYVVRKKEQMAGIWVNSKSMEFENVYDFYSIASTGPLGDIRNDTLLSSLGVGVDHLSFKEVADQMEGEVFKEALIRRKRDDGFYSKDISEVSFWGETLFQTMLKFPKNINQGLYTAEVYLFNDGRLTAMQSMPIEVRKIGFEAYMSNMAFESRWFYGVLCVAMAMFAGWLASVVFGRI